MNETKITAEAMQVLCDKYPEVFSLMAEHCLQKKIIGDTEREVAALRAQLDREKDPEPLTLEQLREMDGKPVWIEPIHAELWMCNSADGVPRYGLVRKSWVRVWYEESGDTYSTTWDFEDYGKTWLAFARKPKEG